MIDGLCSFADHQQVFFECRPFLADPDVDLVLELAVATSAPLVIKHNPPDFRGFNSMEGDGWCRERVEWETVKGEHRRVAVGGVAGAYRAQ